MREDDDFDHQDDASDYGYFDYNRESPNDGDDLIEIGDNPLVDSIYAHGGGGNDKMIGSIHDDEMLYGGGGDDKIWANNPDQIETNNSGNEIFGNGGNDIIYGSAAGDELYGDWEDEYYNEGGDDIIYTGGANYDDADYAHGGAGDDKIYGEGTGTHNLYGEWGDDKIFGGDGRNYIWGDDFTEKITEGRNSEGGY